MTGGNVMKLKVITVCALAILLSAAASHAQSSGGAAAADNATSEITASAENKQNSSKASKNDEDKIKWSGALGESLATAREAKKPLAVFVYAEWCGWCKKMERETFADKKIIKLSDSFVCVKANPEEDENFSSRFKIKEFPCVIFLKSDGTEIERHLGFKTSEEFEKIMKNILEPSK